MKAGDIIYITQGEYSSYGVVGIFLVKQEFNEEAEVAECHRIAQSKLRLRDYGCKSIATWLLDKGYVVEMDAEELHGLD